MDVYDELGVVMGVGCCVGCWLGGGVVDGVEENFVLR